MIISFTLRNMRMKYRVKTIKSLSQAEITKYVPTTKSIIVVRVLH